MFLWVNQKALYHDMRYPVYKGTSGIECQMIVQWGGVW